MLKGKEVIGRRIVTLDGGERLDSVRDLIFDEQGNHVLALLIDEGGWFHSARVIPFGNVRSVGEDAIMVGSAADVVSAKDDPVLTEAMNSKTGLAGLNLLTTDGKALGRIADVFFDEISGRVVGYEATGGLFSDLSSGRTFVPAPESVTIGAEAAIVPPEVAHAMEEQEAGGLQGAFGSAADSVKAAAGTVADNVKEAAGNVAQATRERQKTFVVGKTAASDVTTDAEGDTPAVTVVRAGDVITAAQADEAERLGLLGSLTAAAGGGAMQELYGSARENVQGGLENIGTATRERQKEYVVGRTAGSDVQSPDGLVIVPRGETISAVHAGIAEDKGVLGALVAAATGGSVQEGLQGVREAVTSRLPSGTADAPEALLGRRVQRDVYGPNRTFVAAQGQIVTLTLLERARSLGREADLAAAVNGGAPAESGVAVASERLASGAQNVKEGAAGLLERARSWIAETRDRATDEVEERRIEDAVGRPVNRVVLDPQDQVILNIGEIITHRAVEQARASGVLGILLGSVSTETPVIDPLAVKPDEHGQAALDSQKDVPATPDRTDLEK
ncbi:PRC-barrel domain-containing protein [Deinococcus aquiradiocola]|uniref:PRC-barrel domain-containing protein n=1 Tax=Deinococcus aquiradiocola TaxID=393059 RepID=A0A917PFL5_9DEIO|nr:PRC-barrel domain-containing protein [Deinococcus aquiradiocola]GGJ74980.1 hypothetical protein GCM10008939_19110 [Deinococcus aquiradiocola]